MVAFRRVRGVPTRGGAKGHRHPPVVLLAVVALAVTACVAAGCGSKTSSPSSTGAARVSPSAKAGPSARAQLVAYMAKLNRYDPKGAGSGADMDQTFAQLKTLDLYDTAAVQAMARRLTDIADAIGKGRDHFAAIRPPRSAMKSHRRLLTALDELQTALDHLASCMVSRNHAEYDMAMTECRYAVQDAEAWQRMLKAEAKALKVKVPPGLLG